MASHESTEVMVMKEIDAIRARLEVAPRAADSLAGTLAVALDAFGILLASCRSNQDRSVELFAAFAFGAAAATEGQHILLTAPSLPPAYGLSASHRAYVHPDLDATADALAALAGALSARLSSAARDAADPGDLDACRAAAHEAAQLHELLARGD